MSMQRLVTWITFLAIFAMAAQPALDSDSWWHLRAGQWMVEHGEIAKTDPFSYTRQGQPWEYPGWLVQIPMYLIYRLAGLGGLNLWRAAMVTLALYFIWRTLSGGVFLRAFVLVLAATVAAAYWSARPNLMTFLLAALYLWVLEDFRWRRGAFAQDTRRLSWLLWGMVAWANSHGGFAVGFIIWGVYLVGELWVLAGVYFAQRQAGGLQHPEVVAQYRRTIQLGVTGVFMILAVCINPSGPGMLAYPFKTVGIEALQEHIQEWQSPNFHQLHIQPFIWLLVATLAAVGASRRRLALVDFLLVSGFAYMTLLAARNIAIFALVAPMVLTRHAAPALESAGRLLGFRLATERRPTRTQARLNLMLLGLVVLVVGIRAASAVLPATNQDFIEANFPAGAVAYLQEARPEGRLFNSYNYGGYLLWTLPEYPVFVDGRTDLYNDELISEWLQVTSAQPGWQEVLDRWQVNLVLLEPKTAVLPHLEEAGWRQVYADELAVVYAR